MVGAKKFLDSGLTRLKTSLCGSNGTDGTSELRCGTQCRRHGRRGGFPGPLLPWLPVPKAPMLPTIICIHAVQTYTAHERKGAVIRTRAFAWHSTLRYCGIMASMVTYTVSLHNLVNHEPLLIRPDCRQRAAQSGIQRTPSMIATLSNYKLLTFFAPRTSKLNRASLTLSLPKAMRQHMADARMGELSRVPVPSFC